MMIPEEFKDIRPFEPEELPEAIDRLFSSEQFRSILPYIFPEIPVETLHQKMKEVKNSMEFQRVFSYKFVYWVLNKTAKSVSFNSDAIDKSKNFTFLSNHRDIVLDSAILDVLLIDAGFDTSCEIAIGDNLLSLPWVKDLVRINKSFIVERGLPPRQMLIASKRLSNYMHFVITNKNENIWIAQREGRAKDSNDRTQEALLKMLTIGGEGSLADKLKEMHIVPLAISYEYDPCDYLKAMEFQLKRDNPEYKKSAQDDIISMQTGIMGYKGRIHYHSVGCIDSFLESLDSELSKNDFYAIVAQHIDQQIHANYRLYANNYIALDLLENNNQYSNYYTHEEKQTFEDYITGQLNKIQIENKDEAYLRERILTMYANPAINHFKAI
ncbi:1-acyl-sn-glycerol-3-phosphate acyltransferase [Prevotella sp. oral taxon 299]|uniref:1-acyl-sn-glycerol-3-phosphate acyltransferase n=1 Tax=Prevotella sp. oral taxon 299 TaxID=652716 RepID=UPI0001C3F26F|nr:1-acyl-sn-glycerol-3-phosphate acyltransferase [Prevotella sp. oral taxon 299]